MAYSKNTYTGDGSTTDFAVSFPYLDVEHVGVTVDGVATDFSWVNSGTVSVDPAPALGATVEVRRDSNRSAKLSSFSDPQSLTAAALNYDSLQNFYVAQEAFDALSDAVLSAGSGDMLGLNNLSDVASPSAARTNLGALASTDPAISGNLTLDDAPTLPAHAVTKAYVDAAIAAIPGGSGETNTASNVGGEAEVFKEKSGVDFRFRTLKAGTGVVITEGTNDITIDATLSKPTEQHLALK